MKQTLITNHGYTTKEENFRMRIDFFPAEGNFYKANLHCHTTFSDGKATPEEVKEQYKSHGYSIVAYTDHNNCINHAELDDEGFLAITSYEADYNRKTPEKPIFTHLPCFHINFYAKDRENAALINPLMDRIANWNRRLGRAADYVPAYHGEPGVEEYSQEAINKLISDANALGYLVCLNHPCWSLQTYNDYDKLEGLWAMEIVNFGCENAGFIEDATHIYDRMLRFGKRLFPVCSDDNHNARGFEPPYGDSFGGFTVIRAPELKYGTIMKALENGDFFCSSGPLFEEAYYEDGKVYVKCSPVRSIRLLNEGRDAPIKIAPKGELITEAVFDVDPAFVGKFIRVDLRDDEGHLASTKPIYMSDIL